MYFKVRFDSCVLFLAFGWDGPFLSAPMQSMQCPFWPCTDRIITSLAVASCSSATDRQDILEVQQERVDCRRANPLRYRNDAIYDLQQIRLRRSAFLSFFPPRDNISRKKGLLPFRFECDRLRGGRIAILHAAAARFPRTILYL